MKLRKLGIVLALTLAIVSVASAANTKAAIFVPHALQECAQIRQQMADLQAHAAMLNARYQMLGGDNMDGLSTFDFSAYGLTTQEFKDGMNDLVTAHNAVPLSNLVGVGSYVKVLKLSEGL
jgi:hypothetical protein